MFFILEMYADNVRYGNFHINGGLLNWVDYWFICISNWYHLGSLSCFNKKHSVLQEQKERISKCKGRSTKTKCNELN